MIIRIRLTNASDMDGSLAELSLALNIMGRTAVRPVVLLPYPSLAAAAPAHDYARALRQSTSAIPFEFLLAFSMLLFLLSLTASPAPYGI